MTWKTRAADASVILVLGAYAIPVFWQLLTSFKPDALLLQLPPILPAELTTAHYQAVWSKSLMPRALWNSLGVAAITTLLALGLGLPAAYALARLPVPGTNALLLALVAGTAFPQIAIVSPLYLLIRGLGLRDTWTALVVANTSFALPLVIWLLAGFIREIPEELEEAAALDGAGRVQIIRWVMLPLVAPAMASVGLLAFLVELERVPVRLHFHRQRGEPNSARRPRALPRRVRGTVGRHRRGLDPGQPAPDPDRGRAPALPRARPPRRRSARVTAWSDQGALARAEGLPYYFARHPGRLSSSPSLSQGEERSEDGLVTCHRPSPCPLPRGERGRRLTCPHT